MTGFSSFFVAALTGVLGAVATGVVTSVCNDLFFPARRTDVGASWLLMILAIVGGVVCFALGLMVARMVAGQPEPSLARALAISCGPLVAITGAALLVVWLRADSAPKIDGHELELAVELRLPVGLRVPTYADACVGMHAPDGRVQVTAPLKIKRAQQVDGRWVFAAVVPLLTSGKQKVMFATIGPETTLKFALPLRGRPSRDDMTWSAWIESEPTAAPSGASPEGQFAVRYRVKLAEPAAPESTDPTPR